MDISPTYAKQEADVIKKIIEQSTYSETLKRVTLELAQFETRHFKHLNLEKLLKRVIEISIKLKKLGLINNYSLNEFKKVSGDVNIVFDIQDKVIALDQYKQQLESLEILKDANEGGEKNEVEDKNLMSLISKNKRNKKLILIGTEIVCKKRVYNYYLAKIIFPIIKNRDDYKAKRKQYIKKLEYRVRILRKYFKLQGFTIGMKTAADSDFSELKQIKN